MATNAIETAQQENGSRYWFETSIERNKEPTDAEMKRIYGGYNIEWKDTYRKQTVALKQFLKGQKGYMYSRDNGIMPYIEQIASKQCGVGVKDRWNPMDIVMVKRGMERVVSGTIKELTNIDGMSKDAKLELLNAYMRETLQDKVLIGVSLKAIKKTKKSANAETANMGDKKTKINLDLVPGSIKCTLTLGRKNNYLFDTGELGFDMKTERGGKIHGQSRNFQYSKERNLVQTDLTPKGADAGAKLGKVSSQALDGFLQGMNMTRPSSASKHPHIPPVGQWNDSHKEYWKNLYQKLQGKNIDFGDVAVYQDGVLIQKGFDQVLDFAIDYETNRMDRSSAGRFSSKLIAMEWAHIWTKIAEQGKMVEWCRCLYYGAKKEFSSKNGPFLKIY
tara:strand:+ start:5066 stop:6235 length:1170 start_codon:yes stop_codon:yes gene_type:complete